MGLNLDEMAASSKVRGDFPTCPAGTRPGRVIHVVDLGIQSREFRGQKKEPCRKLLINFELVNDEFKNQDGETRRHRVSPKAFNMLKDPKAKIHEFLGAIDPNKVIGKDFEKLANLPAMVNVVHNKKMLNGKEVTYANFGGVMPVPDGFPVKELSSPAVVFSFDNPTEESYRVLPQYMKGYIQNALNFRGSKVEQIHKKLEVEYQEKKAKEVAASPF